MRVTRHPYEIDGWGVGELWVGDGRVVVAHDPPTPRPPVATCPKRPPGAPRVSLLKRYRSRSAHETATGSCRNCCKGSTATSRGEPVSFADVPLDEDWATPFQAALAGALRNVPWGEVVTYGELAALAGRPRAARAAGTFCAENRFSLFVPCHRVVVGGGIGGYGSLGVEYKRRLLALEGHAAL